MNARFTDQLLPFQIEAGAVRGRLVRLESSLDAIVGAHELPLAAAERLAETLLLGATLAGGLKYDGVFTLQIQAKGAISLVVADVTSQGGLRGYARCDAARLAEAELKATTGPVPRYFGEGFLAFTVDQGPDTDRYQGIVELAGDTLGDCAEGYLSQSEQIASAVRIAVAPPAEGRGWRGAGLVIQRMPQGPNSPILTAERAEDDWRRAGMFLASLRDSELLDPALSGERLLNRLFHADGLLLHSARPLAAACRCSRERVETTLRSFGKADLTAMTDEEGRIVVTCEFCKSSYVFAGTELDALLG